MKEFSAIMFSVLLLSMGFSSSSESFAVSIKDQKLEVIEDLKVIKENSEISKKSKTLIKKAIIKLEKSLNEKYWKDDSTVNFKHGKKVLSADFNAVKKLDIILKNKKISEELKNEITDLNLRITNIDKTFLENSIASLEEMIMGQKGEKKISKAIIKFEKGNEFLENQDYAKALKKYENAWNQIKKALKDPHLKKMRMIEGEGTIDMNFDKIPDVYLKIINSTKLNKPKIIEMKITDECVNGITHDDAKMKFGLTTPVILSTEYFDEEVKATNKWLKQNDPDKKINPAIITTVPDLNDFPITGDDMIQKNPEDTEGSFNFSPDTSEILGNQEGEWSGKFSIIAEPGNHHLRFFFPLTEPTNQGDSCNFIASFAIPQTFE